MASSWAQAEEVLFEIDVAPVWSTHPTATPKLFTSGDYQYAAFYDDDRQLTLAQRALGEREWAFERFPVVTTWPTGGHARIALTVDADGYVHMVPYRRGLAEAPSEPPNMIYYRTEEPHDITSFEQTYMIEPDEPNPGYPTFITDPEDRLYFEYRIGGSGRGSQQWNVYDRKDRSWTAMPMLLDGRGEMSAYGGPRLGPDGVWRCLWMWRDTPHAETNHTLSFMRSDDLLNWENAAGEPVALPVTIDNSEVVVDAAAPGEGLINMVHTIGWDSEQQPVIAYHRYDEDGNSQIYNARFEEGAWNIVAATDWDFRWGFQGTGALPAEARAEGVRAMGEGRLVQRVWSEPYGAQRVVLDEATLDPIDIGPADANPDTAPPAWRRARSEPESDFDARPMSVRWINDKGSSGEPGVRYVLRWEVGPNNNDRPVPEPWPDPTMLRLYKIGS